MWIRLRGMTTTQWSGHIRPQIGVMAGLVPAIHVFIYLRPQKTWMRATSAGMT
jgi:hypothetical protein